MPNLEGILVWHGLLDSDRLRRYYGYLADKYSRQEKRLSSICFGVSSGAVVAVLSDHPVWAVALAAVVVLLNGWLIKAKLSKRALSGAFRQQRFGESQLEWEKLWSELRTGGRCRLPALGGIVRSSKRHHRIQLGRTVSGPTPAKAKR